MEAVERVNGRYNQNEENFFSNIGMVKLLLDHGADRRLVNNKGKTAADLAEDANVKKLVRIE